MKVKLTLFRADGDKTILTYDRPTEITLGRSPNCTICLDFDPMVSRMHAVLLIDPPSVRIKDLNSTNGIVVNDEPLGGPLGGRNLQPCNLKDGDSISIGSTNIQVSLAEETAVDDDDGKSNPSSESTVVNIAKAELLHREEMMLVRNTMTRLATLLPEIPGFTVRKYLGSGKNGAVYQALSVDGKKVALKIMVPDIAFTRKMIENFVREIQKVKELDHPNLVQVFDSGATGEKNIYLVMEFVNGEDLGSYLLRCTDHRIHARASCNIIMQMASAISYAHLHGFVHKHVKPQNIILYDNSGKLMAKVSDVGLAKCLEDSGISRPNGIFSSRDSLGYIPPEQLTDFRDTRPTVDVFALGAVFYEMLTGFVPYNFGEGDSDRLTVVSKGDIVPIEKRIPGIPEPLAVIVERCLSVDPDERYRDGSELLTALQNVAL